MQGSQQRNPGWKQDSGRRIHCRNKVGTESQNCIFTLRKAGCWPSLRSIEQKGLLGSLMEGSPDVHAGMGLSLQLGAQG